MTIIIAMARKSPNGMPDLGVAFPFEVQSPAATATPPTIAKMKMTIERVTITVNASMYCADGGEKG
jgi:hypothetical protein